MAAASVSSPTSALGALSVASERSASPGSPKRKQAELDTISEVSLATASALDQLQAPPQPAADRRARRTSVRVSADGQAIQQQAGEAPGAPHPILLLIGGGDFQQQAVLRVHIGHVDLP